MTHTCLQVYLHIIFATKDREALITPEIESRLYEYLGGIARKRECVLLRINGMDDHVHMLLKLHADTPISTLLKELKSYSSGWVKKQGNREFSWQIGYAGYSCSITHVDPLIKYIDNQKQHHQTRTFDEELAILNKMWGTSWNG